MEHDGRDRKGGWTLGLAALGAAAAASSYALARRAEERAPPLGRFVNVDGVRLHVVERGEGEPVVLLNGNGTMAHDWLLSGLVDAAAERFRVIAIDRPGYGYSERPRDRLWTASAQADLLARAFTRLGLYRPVVLGHSWGALTALAIGCLHPRAARGLVLLSGYYYPTARKDVWLFAPPGVPVLGDVLRYTISPAIGALIAPKVYRTLFAPRPVPRRFAEGFPLGLALRPWQIRASAEDSGLMVPSAAALRDLYQGMDLPTAVFTGSGDRLVTPGRQALRLHRALPDATLHVVPEAGHMVHYEAPDEIAQAIGDVMTRAAERLPAVLRPEEAVEGPGAPTA